MKIPRLKFVNQKTWAAFLLGCFVFLTACAETDQNGPINIGFVGEEGSLQARGLRLSFAGQHVKGATNQGLVAFDPAGRIVPDLAERWHVSPDGLFYTFKLRNASWPNDEPITAEEARGILIATIDRLEGTSLGLDLAKLVEIKAMTGRVIELRLSSPMPDFLRLLAQPELGLVADNVGSGPMQLERDENSDLFLLSALPPESRGLPAQQDWENQTRFLTVRALPAEQAVSAFSEGKIDLLLNGSLADLPLAELGPLSRGTVQIDPTQGIFGLAFLTSDGFFSDPRRREAMSMSLDREGLIQPFGLAGWEATSVVVPPSLSAQAGGVAYRWHDLDLERRRTIAAERIKEWKSAAGSEVIVRLRLPAGPGNDELFEQIRQSWSEIGIDTVRASEDEPADLELRDRIARYSSQRWFLNQFNCQLNRGLCSSDADALVAASLELRDTAAKASVLADAHAVLLEEEVFIPFGQPVRWSLVRGAVAAYEPNSWGVHPLFPLSQATN